MHSFDPTLPPRGRLARLGVLLDGSEQMSRIVAVARMCERAGIDAVWIAERGTDLMDLGVDDALVTARELSVTLDGAAIGVIVAAERRPVDELAERVLDLARRAGARFEIAIAGGEGLDAYSSALRRATVDERTSAVRLSAVATTTADIGPLLGTVDDIVLAGWRHADLETTADEARAEAADAGRDPATLGVALLLPTSIGRTGAEATARADHDPIFSRLGHPSEVGIFGTLEECQDRVIALAHAGVTDLRCILPRAADIHDVIAQLTAITIGTTDVLRPGSLRSPAPAPPEGWGGRSNRPPRDWISDGSRRR